MKASIHRLLSICTYFYLLVGLFISSLVYAAGNVHFAPNIQEESNLQPAFETQIDSLIHYALEDLKELNDPNDVSLRRLKAILTLTVNLSKKGLDNQVQQYLKLVPNDPITDDIEIIQILGNLNSMRGINRAYIGDFDSAIYFYQKSLNYLEQAGDTGHLPMVRNNYSKILLTRGDYKEAMDILFLNLYEKDQDWGNEVIWRMNIGECLLKMGRYAEARPYIFPSVHYFSSEEFYSPVGLSLGYLNIAETYLRSYQFDSGLYYLDLTMEIAKKGNYENGIISTHSLKSYYYSLIEDWEQTMREAKIVYDHYNAAQLQKRNVRVLLLMMKAAYYLGDRDQANRYFAEGIAICKDILKSKSQELEYLKSFEEIQADQGLYKEAYLTQLQHAELKSELLNEEKNRAILRLESEYKTNEVRQELAISRTEQAAAKALLAQQRLREYFLIGGIIAVIFILFLVGVFYYLLSKSKLKLAQQNEQLKVLNQTKDRFFTIVGHDLRGPITSLSGVEELMGWYLNKNEYSKLQELGGNISQTANQLDVLLNNLLSWASSQSGVIPYHPQNLSLHTVVKEVIQLFFGMLEAKQVRLTIEVDESIKVYADQNALMLVLRNLISNALKFTRAHGEIKVLGVQTENSVEIRIVDNGVGMSEEKLRQILSFGEYKTTSGTANEKGTGLGLMLCKEYTQINKGNLRIESTEGYGSTFIIVLPKFLSENQTKLAS